MTEKSKDMERLQNDYLPKIYGFCCLKTNRKEDAEDLAGDIVLELVRFIRSGKEIRCFNAFVWRVANNTFCKWLRGKKYGNTLYLTELIPSDGTVGDETEQKEEISLLKREIGLLTRNYRDAVVLHYFEGKTCAQIAAAVGKSEGTVKWWLYDARKFIKEGLGKMREFGEKSYRPSGLSMSCQGNPGGSQEPMSCVQRKSTQNILLAAYQKPLSVEELCVELGISAPYIEDEVSFLVQNELMSEAGGKFRTDFVILPGRNLKLGTAIYEKCFPGYSHDLLELLDGEKAALEHNAACFTWDRLLWIYLHLFTDLNLCRFKREECKVVEYNEFPDRPNGGKWVTLGFENNFWSAPSADKYHDYLPFDGPVHKADLDAAQGFFHFWSGLDSSVFFELPQGVFALCRDIIKGETKPEALDEQQKYLFSRALEKKLFIKTGDGYQANYGFIPSEQMKTIRQIADSFYGRAKTYFADAYALVLDEYGNGVPEPLRWQSGNFLSNYLNGFTPAALYDARQNGRLSAPHEDDKAWLSLFATE